MDARRPEPTVPELSQGAARHAGCNGAKGGPRALVPRASVSWPVRCTTGAVGAGTPVASAAAAPSCNVQRPVLRSGWSLDVTAGWIHQHRLQAISRRTTPTCSSRPASWSPSTPPPRPCSTGQATSVPGLLAIIAALPELNAAVGGVPHLELEWRPEFQLHRAEDPTARSQRHLPPHDRGDQLGPDRMCRWP